ncbi:MAG: tol-pal system YbgF family protein [Blastopirellula sp. JB062]
MRSLAILVLMTASTLSLGCGGSQPKPKSSGGSASTKSVSAQKASSEAQADMLQQALVLLEDLDQFNAAVVQREVLQSLNRWLHNRQLAPQWQPDPMIEALPEDLRNTSRMKDLATTYFRDPKYPNTFRGSDFDYLEGCVWAFSLSTYIRDHGKLPAGMTAWIDSLPASISNSDRDDLRTACLLFDWTVRNIQLRKEAKQFAPGTAREPWEALQIGYGDSVERARIFISMARQQGLNAFALELVDVEGEPSTHVVGVEIAGQAYLFDAEYGLPVSDGTGVATLATASASDAVQTGMSSTKYAYPYGPESFQKAIALIDAPSCSLTQAAAVLESQLTGKLRLRLAVEPTKIAERLKNAGVEQVRIWEAPILAEDGIRQRLRDQPGEANQPSLAQQFYMERQLYDQSSPLASGRLLHLMGRFDNEIQRPGARKMYLLARSFDLQIQKLNFREQVEMLESQGMRLPRDPEQQRFFVQAMMSNAKSLKMIASYQLGQIALDSEQYASAIDYFKIRTLKEFPQISFASQARYGLARANAAVSHDDKQSPEEQAASRETAVKWLTYEDDIASPQRRGNTLLAERIIPPAKPAAPQAADSQSEEKDSETEKAPEPAKPEAATNQDESAVDVAEQGEPSKSDSNEKTGATE